LAAKLIGEHRRPIGIHAKPAGAIMVTFITASRRGAPNDRASDRGAESN
jgi:hypothetical protein